MEKPTTLPGRGKVLVRIRAAGINFSDTLMRQNHAVTPELPAIPGTEVAGMIERLSLRSCSVLWRKASLK